MKKSALKFAVGGLFFGVIVASVQGGDKVGHRNAGVVLSVAE